MAHRRPNRRNLDSFSLRALCALRERHPLFHLRGPFCGLRVESHPHLQTQRSHAHASRRRYAGQAKTQGRSRIRENHPLSDWCSSDCLSVVAHSFIHRGLVTDPTSLHKLRGTSKIQRFTLIVANLTHPLRLLRVQINPVFDLAVEGMRGRIHPLTRFVNS